MDSISGRAQAISQGGVASSAVQERQLENRMPHHLPFKVKVKNINNENWTRDLEVEVKNISNKPMYFLDLFLILPELKSSDGHDVGFTLRYGRIQLADYAAPILPEDVPIQPGESYIFKISEDEAKGWEIFKSKEHQQEPKRFEIIFVQLNFGDGTGFHRTDGVPVPHPKSKALTVLVETSKKRLGRIALPTYH